MKLKEMKKLKCNNLKRMIEKHKNNAYRKANEEMILLNLELGKFLLNFNGNMLIFGIL